MAEIILDIGSGRSLHNVKRAEAMLDAVAKMDSHKHKITFKAQLFTHAPPNVALDHVVFDSLYHTAYRLGYEMTASVFDKDSLAFLLGYKVPFVKIACRPDLYWLIGEVPRNVPVYLSVDHFDGMGPFHENITYMACVPRYPALISDYVEAFGTMNDLAISDHTVGWTLMNIRSPRAIEKHLCHEREADNPDSGPFSVTVEELREVIA